MVYDTESNGFLSHKDAIAAARAFGCNATDMEFNVRPRTVLWVGGGSLCVLLSMTGAKSGVRTLCGGLTGGCFFL